MNRKTRTAKGHVAVTVRNIHPDDVIEVRKAAAEIRRKRKEKQARHEDLLKRTGMSEEEWQEFKERPYRLRQEEAERERELRGMMSKSDAYATLGVAARATKKEIKSAWKRHAGQHHPDKGGDPEVFKKGQAAYELLR